MALTATTMVDTPDCLMVAYVDYSKADGAIGKVDVTNRHATRPLVTWARYQGPLTYSAAVAPGATSTQTFRGSQARAGDVTEVGYNL